MSDADFVAAVEAAIRAAHGDSNDAEIASLTSAVDIACSLLGVDIEAVRDRVDKEGDDG